MLNISFLKKTILVASVVLLYSCDKDYNGVGSDLIGDNGFDFELYSSDVVAFNQKLPAIQSNNVVNSNSLIINALGIYDDPAFGTNTSNFVTQINLNTYAPTIGDEPEIQSVVLTIPYFSHVTSVNEDGTSVYALDSISGPANGKLKLSVYESGYYLRDLDPNSDFENQQLYYTDQNSAIDAQKKVLLNDSSNKNQNEEFFFDNSQIVIKTTDPDTEVVTTTYKAPQMTLDLNKDFFQTKILNANASNLASANAFTNYFRGLYFKVEKSGSSPSNLAMLNFSKGEITITYKAKTASTADADTEKEEKTLVLKLTGNTVSLLNESNSTVNYTNATTTANINTATGDDKLYLRGGQGAMAVVELFSKTDVLGYDENGTVTGPNGVSDELDELRLRAKNNQLLINEAHLIFYVDTDQMATSQEPNQIYIYDITNNTGIPDVITPTLFGGTLIKSSTTKKGVSYKIRVTDQIRNLIKNPDAINVKLGLVVLESIEYAGLNKLKTPIAIPQGSNADINISEVPKGSVINPRGTILYGGTENVPADKRLKLQIYYTKPN